jgi:repressor LexA
MRKNKAVTPRQLETLEWIKSFIREYGMPPTIREIGTGLGIRESTVFYLIAELEKKGFLRRGGLRARSLIVKGFGKKFG